MCTAPLYRKALCVRWKISMLAFLHTEARLHVRVGGEANLQRLRAIKAEVDPTNLFRHHHLYGLA